MLVPFDYIAPATIDEAVELAHTREARYIHGGTDILVEIRGAQQAPKLLIGLHKIAALQEIFQSEGRIFIGAGAALSCLAAHPLLQEHCPALVQAILQIGSPQIRNSATLGGNVATASPAADGLLALLAEEAEAEIVSAVGACLIPVEQLITGPKRTKLQPGDLLKGFWVRPQAWDFAQFFKVGKRNSLAISIVNGVVKLKAADGCVERCRIAVGAVAPTPLRLHLLEREICGKPYKDMDKALLTEAIARAVSPIGDIRASAEYRRYIAAESCVALLDQAWEVCQNV